MLWLLIFANRKFNFITCIHSSFHSRRFKFKVWPKDLFKNLHNYFIDDGVVELYVFKQAFVEIFYVKLCLILINLPPNKLSINLDIFDTLHISYKRIKMYGYLFGKQHTVSGVYRLLPRICPILVLSFVALEGEKKCNYRLKIRKILKYLTHLQAYLLEFVN